MKLITRFTPVAVHFGALDTRVLQLSGNRTGWTVRLAESAAAQGHSRHSQVVSTLAGRLRGQSLGRDAVLSTSASVAGITVVPVEKEQHNRLRAILEETALRMTEDSEGISYRYLNLPQQAAETESREGYLLLSLGQSELRRCTAAGEALNLRPVGLELSAFPIARCIDQAAPAEMETHAFLHLGFDHALFGILHQGELRFLKTMQRSAADLIDRLEQSLSTAQPLPAVAALQGNEETVEPAEQLHRLCAEAEQQSTTLHRVLRLEAENIAQEARACLRHFTARHPGCRLEQVQLTGFGAGLPSICSSLEQALNITAQTAQPFTALGIEAPTEVLEEQHLWCGPLGLALRGKE